MRHQLFMTLLLLLFANNLAAKTESSLAPDVVMPPEKPQTKPPVSRVPVKSRGEMLYTNHCLDCHESVVHIREQRSAKNLEALRNAIIRWSQELQLRWSFREVEDVVQYLNLHYYHYSE